MAKVELPQGQKLIHPRTIANVGKGPSAVKRGSAYARRARECTKILPKREMHFRYTATLCTQARGNEECTEDFRAHPSLLEVD